MHLRSEKSILTQDRVRELLDYDPDTGVFTRKSAASRYSVSYEVGDVAGSLNRKGYIQICVDGEVHLAHRLAWLYMTGAWPNLQIDHRDTNKANNVWDNLREATNGQNKANTPVYKCTRSGLKGAYWEAKRGKWASKIRVDSRLRHVGYFDSAEEAHRAFVVAAASHHGEFARA
jgi:hypothetical protein